jgi:hypothetical protein
MIMDLAHAISNFDGPGKAPSRSKRDRRELWPLSPSPPAGAYRQERAGPTAASFSSHVAQGFPLRLFAIRNWHSSPTLPSVSDESLLVRITVTGKICIVMLGHSGPRAHHDLAHRNLIAPQPTTARHDIAALLLPLQLQRNPTTHTTSWPGWGSQPSISSSSG